MHNEMIQEGTPVVVLGFGITGRVALRYLSMLGARVYVSDARPEKKLSPQERALLQECGAEYEGGAHSLEFLRQGEFIFISPGIPVNLKVVVEAKKAGVNIVGELALAAPALQCPVVAVTGTNGKTTVTTLIGDLLRAAGKEVFVCGNIGRPLLECLMLEQQPDVAVVEVSSFQLENCGKFRPDVAVLLNITPDHIDWHGSFADYIAAKAKIFSQQRSTDTAILYTDDVICLELAEQLQERAPVLFGHSRDCHGYICESEVYVRRQNELEKYDLAGTVFDNPVGRVNCAAAILAAKSAGSDWHSIMDGLHSFKALPHRMEYVAVIDGVSYWNDSKATNTGAVISALKQAGQRIILIAGGRDKGEDYRLLRDSLRAKVVKLILIGEAAESIGRQLEDIVEVDYLPSLEEAVAKASRVARPGDTVLLSPACASFDMFESYEHRGRIFRESVAGLQLKRDAATLQTGREE